MVGELAEARREGDRRVHDGGSGLARRVTRRAVLSSIPVLSMTGSTAPCRAPPSDVKSFWYSMSTTAVLDGSMTLGLLASGAPSLIGGDGHRGKGDAVARREIDTPPGRQADRALTRGRRSGRAS